jgi:hypothetical protein
MSINTVGGDLTVNNLTANTIYADGSNLTNVANSSINGTIDNVAIYSGSGTLS